MHQVLTGDVQNCFIPFLGHCNDKLSHFLSLLVHFNCVVARGLKKLRLDVK